MNYSLVCNSCISTFLYKAFYPNINEYFIEYNNPLISSWIPEESLEPYFSEPLSVNWEKDTGRKRSFSGDNYPVMFLGDIEIHWIHEKNESLLLKKFKGRLELSKKHEPIFLWLDPGIYNIHTEEERKILVNRFNNIDRKTIFLTKYRNEEYQNSETIVKFIPEWEGKSQYDRENNFLIRWYSRDTEKVFKELIEIF